MKENRENFGVAGQLITSVRVVIFTMVFCCVMYTLLIWAVGRIFTPETAEGSFLRNGSGKIIGSSRIAQGFTQKGYFWPRPSAVNYNASATGGSNLSPANPELTTRAQEIIQAMNVTKENPVPADLVTASGSGLDPHITLHAARYQAERVAKARGVPVETVIGILEKHAVKTGGPLTSEPLVNVLLVNKQLDETTR